MNVVIPIAGTNTANDETEYIKSLQEIDNKTILQYVFDSLKDIKADHFVVVIRRCDVNKYHLDSIVKLLRPDAEIVVAEGKTMGAACSCLLAIDKLDLSQPLLISGSDQILIAPLKDIIGEFEQKNYDAGVVIFDDIHPRWSYVRLNKDNLVIEAAEKHPISRNATAGFYYFKKTEDFIKSAEKMILKNASVNGSYYICPALNEMILAQEKIGVYRIEKAQYYSLRHSSGMEAYRNYIKEKQEAKA